MMILLSPIHLCVTVNVCKQTTSEIPEVTSMRSTIIYFFARYAPDMGYQPEGGIMVSLP